MTRALLVLLALLVGIAPAASIQTSAPNVEQPADAASTEDEKNEEKPPARPTEARWSTLNPAQTPGPLRIVEHDDESDEVLPDWPPALYARRLAAEAPAPQPLPSDPPRPDVRAGHLNLPPPLV